MLALVLASALSGLELGVITASSADLATTHLALSRPGYVEANPVLVEGPILYITKVGTTAAVVGISRHFRKQGHHRTAKIICILAIGTWTGAAVWNAHQMSHR